MNKKIKSLLKSKTGIQLDVGCGDNKQTGFVGMDIRKLPTVDIVHDAEVIPYPLPRESCSRILVNHLIEHICPRKIIGLMNEWWELLKPEGQLLISMPYAGSQGFWQDPTHCHSWNEATVYYFDPYPAKLNGKPSPLYYVYKPRPWTIQQNDWFGNGNVQIILKKRSNDVLEK